jgi:hypothetical protein
MKAQVERPGQGDQQRPLDEDEIAEKQQQASLRDAQTQAGQVDAPSPTMRLDRAQEDFFGQQGMGDGHGITLSFCQRRRVDRRHAARS